MLERELGRKTGAAVGAVLLLCVAGGMVGYRSYSHKQVDQIVAQREWQMNREKGLPLSMEADPNASPEERKQARIAAIEKMEFKGSSPVEGDPNGAPAADAAVSVPTPPPVPGAETAPPAPPAPPAAAPALPAAVPAEASPPAMR